MENVELHKRALKGGSFLNLFDWNSKSRKKLFSDSTGSYDKSANQGKVKPETLPGPRLLRTNVEEQNASSSYSGRVDWNCNSSPLLSYSGSETRAPGVVARLMGLESLPTSEVPQSCSTSSPGFNFSRGSRYYNKQETFTRDPRIERFQTEILPPRSAKPISVTHHKLLSPIKNPALVRTKDAAHMVEAAAKIIEASPNEAVRAKVRPSITASLPPRMQDSKMKLEAQQNKKPGNLKIVNGKSNNRTPQGMRDARIMRRDMESGNTSRSLSSKTRVSPPAEPAKANRQRREGKSQAFNRNFPSERELKKSQRRTSTNRASANVLKQNSQKQNSSSGRFYSGSKASSDPKISPNETRTVNAVSVRAESKPSDLVRTNMQRDSSLSSSYSGMKTISQKKSTADKEISSMRNIATDVLTHNDDRPMKSKITADVISFTFTSPIKRSSESQSPVRPVKSINSYASGKSLTLSSPENMIGESSLSILLDQKIQELKDRVECYIAEGSFTSMSSVKEEEGVSTCTSSIQDSVCTLNHLGIANAEPDVDERSSQSNVDSSSMGDQRHNCQAQIIEAMEDCSMSASSSRTEKDFDHQLPSVSSLEPLLVAGSGPDSMITCNGKEESPDLLSAIEFPEVEEDNRTELSDTVSSSSFADIREDQVAPALSNDTNFNHSGNWEIEYIRDIVGEAESLIENFSTTHSCKIINASLFDELEGHGNGVRSSDEEEIDKLRRKILFDFVSECLVLRCQDLLIGAPKGWARFTALFRRKRLLVQEIFQEVMGGNFIRDMMVDVLVDKDMNSKYGRWLDFRVETFEEGMEIGQGILSSLVDEMVEELAVFS